MHKERTKAFLFAEKISGTSSHCLSVVFGGGPGVGRWSGGC